MQNLHFSISRFGSNKLRIQKEPNRTLGLSHSGNQPSLTEKFDTVYGIAEQCEHTSNKTRRFFKRLLGIPCAAEVR